MAEPHGQLMRYKKRRRRPSLFLRLRGGRCPGGEQVLRLRARDGAFRAPARVTFFCCQKKVTKENHLDLRFKDPLARCWLCKIGGADLAELVRRGTLSVRGIACTSCAAAADSSEGRGICFYRVGGVSPPRRRAGVAPAGASCFLFMSKESSQRTPLKERGISNFPLSLRILSP